MPRGDVLPTRGLFNDRKRAGAASSAMHRVRMRGAGAIAAAIVLFSLHRVLFASSSSSSSSDGGDFGTSGGVRGGGSFGHAATSFASSSSSSSSSQILAVSSFTPARVDVAAAQRSCAPRKDPAADRSTKKDGDEGGPMVVLVTGSAGFVGFHTSIALRELGAGVLGLDNVNDYYPTSLKRARLRELDSKGVHTVEADVNDRNVLRDVLDACKFTHVLHLAAQAGVRYAAKNPGAYVHSNVAGMVNVMEEVVRTSPTPSVVFASSSSVYGLNTKVRCFSLGHHTS
jgi:hypothetical protein